MSSSNQTAHTPGPWIVYTTATGIVRVHGPLYTLATAESLEDGINNAARHKEREANARLIAAAPTLLEALEACEYEASCALADVSDRTPEGKVARRNLERLGKLARAAIARAKGGAS